jgi:two-component system chemotaxis response regulator CheB
MAASAGGLAAVMHICAALPPDFPVPIVLAQHLRRQQPSLLVEVLQRRTPLAVHWGQDGAVLQAGTIVVAPPDFHLLINADGTQALTQSPPVHFVRPAADPLFASVASRFRTRAVGVVLTGTGGDGARGAAMIKHMGGRVLAQDALSAQYFAMPSAAIATGCVDFVLPLAYIAPALLTLVMAPAAAALFRVGPAFSHAHVGRTPRGQD